MPAQEVGPSRWITLQVNMQKSLVLPVKREKFQFNPIESGIILILFGTALLSLRTPARDYLIPLAPYLQLGLQVGVFVLCIPFVRIKMQSQNFWFLIVFLALFVVALSSSFWSSFPDLVFRRTLMILSTSLIIAVLAFADKHPQATFTRLAKALALFGAVISLFGLVAYFWGKLELTDFGRVQSLVIGPFKISQRVYGSAPFLRISSLFGNPNTLAAWLLVTLTMTIYLLLNSSRRATWGLLAVIQGSALILTFSRAGISATLVSLVLLWYFSGSKHRSRKRRTFILGFLVLSLVSVLVLHPFRLPQSERLSVDLNLRELAWAPLWASIRNNPMLGVGFGVSYEAILEPEGLEFGAHNAFLAIMSELGLPGFSLFLLLWLIPIWYARRKLQFAPSPTRLVLATCLAISLALIPHQAFEGSILRYGFHTLLWVYLLCLMVHPVLERSDAESK